MRKNISAQRVLTSIIVGTLAYYAISLFLAYISYDLLDIHFPTNHAGEGVMFIVFKLLPLVCAMFAFYGTITWRRKAE
jgi:hypothetical protein